MRGGKREGAGRKLGSASKRTREIADKAAENGEMPLEYMLRVMRDKTVDYQRRDWAADKAAPYVHNRLAAVEHTGKDGGAIEQKIDLESIATWLIGLGLRPEGVK